MPPQKAREYFEKRSVRLPAIGRKNIETILIIPTIIPAKALDAPKS